MQRHLLPMCDPDLVQTPAGSYRALVLRFAAFDRQTFHFVDAEFCSIVARFSLFRIAREGRRLKGMDGTNDMLKRLWCAASVNAAINPVSSLLSNALPSTASSSLTLPLGGSGARFGGWRSWNCVPRSPIFSSLFPLSLSFSRSPLPPHIPPHSLSYYMNARISWKFSVLLFSRLDFYCVSNKGRLKY